VSFSFQFDPLSKVSCLLFEQDGQGVIKVGTLAKIRRLHLREGVPIKEIERRTGLARSTIKAWLRKDQMVEPK
jgi:hypothetical protein